MKKEKLKLIRVSNEFDKKLKILKAFLSAKTFADTLEILADYYIDKENLNFNKE